MGFAWTKTHKLRNIQTLLVHESKFIPKCPSYAGKPTRNNPWFSPKSDKRVVVCGVGQGVRLTTSSALPVWLK